ncbi:cell division protein ZapE [Pseudomonas sp. gcc21]|uniref:cell division protein ZapE n=1 Tax=Pseudomonas sp. gcc21 TaxID=2726989 RepID=UPI0014528CFF|nr:cell division protein ZapE [Pseudomonas sp. gcc21]QJD58040.1 cell division protein ZapE [Pseudomonas sp. gcc21]
MTQHAPLPPSVAYQRAVRQQGFEIDLAQQQAVQLLDDCHQALHSSHATAVSGVYLWGPVGRGKTWLMDAFHQGLTVPARRQHFHRFMSWVHQRLFQLNGTANPLHALADELAREVRVLCFDELFVNDIGDAILLGNLFQLVFDRGVVLVATSNQPPDQLYADGFNRERFLPAIAALNQHMHVVSVDGGVDHRLRAGHEHQRYWVVNGTSTGPLHNIFNQLSSDAPASAGSLQLGHREVPVLKHTPSVAWFSFDALCRQALSTLDFIGLCDRFEAILLSGVPCLSAAQRPARIARGTEDGVSRVIAGDRELPRLSIHDDSVRRFIGLVDECYDRRIPLYIEAAVPLSELYTEGHLTFAFRRTLSRLQEMQRERFGADHTRAD